MEKLDRRIFDDDISISLSPINQYSSKVIEEDSEGLSCIFEKMNVACETLEKISSKSNP